MTAVVLIMLTCIRVRADSGRLYAEYVPRTERGTLFYLDIYYDGDISAAIFEISYDSSIAEYRSWAAEHDSSTFKAKAENGIVKLVFGDSGSIKGKICRLRFKQLSDGTVNFTLRMTEGADGGLNYIDPPPAYTVTVALDSGSGSSGSSGSPRSTRYSYSGSKSGKSGTASTEGATGDEHLPEVRDLTHNDDMKFFLLGAGAAAAAALLIALGFILGRRQRKKNRLTADELAQEAAEAVNGEPPEHTDGTAENDGGDK